MKHSPFRVIIITFCLFFSFNIAFSQSKQKSEIKGTVVDNEEKGIPQCLVLLVELNRWTTTDIKGYFELKGIELGTYTITIQSLGMQKFEQKIVIDEIRNYNLSIRLNPISFSMEEVVVLAKESRESGSSSVIEKTAIEHLQPSSLKDILQLLPGKLSINPNLSSEAHINIRDAGNDANSSFGTAVIIDGAPISNNAEIKTKNSANAAINSQSIDVRHIATSNIESVEVIRGVAPAMYGDLTTGAVIIKTKSGFTPLNAKISVNPNIKNAYIGKGFSLNDFGAINLDIDYTHSVDNTVTPYKGFNRLSAELGYSNTFMKNSTPLSFNIKTKYYQTIDVDKVDPDIIKFDEYEIDKENGYRLNIYGKWNLNKKFISNIIYNISGNIKNQNEETKKRIGLGYIQAISNARKDTLMEGVYAPSEYDSEMKLLGMPYNIYTQLSANTIFQKKNILNNTSYGLDFRMSGNMGEGRIYEELRPPRLTEGNATRPRPYKDIPAMQQVSFFLENKLTLDIKKTKLIIQTGLRYNNYQPLTLFKSSLKQNIEPRINVKYNVLENKEHWFEKLALFAAYGIQSKSPSITHLYPDVAYFDLISFNYFSNNPKERLLLVNTKVINTKNNDLQPIISHKHELGVEGKIKRLRFNVTAYYEKTNNGLNFSKHYEFTPFKKWEYTDPNIVYETNKKPIVNFDKPTKIDTFITSYSKPVNNLSFIKKGIEYRLDFPKIKAIQTRFNISGAYLFTKGYRNEEYIHVPTGSQANQLPYVSIFGAGEGYQRSRLNTNIIAITNIPKIKLVFSTTLQIIWIDTYKIILPEEHLIKYEDQQGKVFFAQIPAALMDKNYRRIKVNAEKMLRPENEFYISKYEERYFFTEKEPIHFQVNLKVSSEIGKYSKLAFFANNVTMYNPKYEQIRSNSIAILNNRLYFGLELTFLL